MNHIQSWQIFWILQFAVIYTQAATLRFSGFVPSFCWFQIASILEDSFNRLPIFNLFHKMIFLDLSGCISLQLQLQLSKRRKIPGPHALHDNARVGCQGCHLCRTSRFGLGSLDIQPPNAVDERYPASIDMENLTLFTYLQLRYVFPLFIGFYLSQVVV